jgi:hypothetical protein
LLSFDVKERASQDWTAQITQRIAAAGVPIFLRRR